MATRFFAKPLAWILSACLVYQAALPIAAQAAEEINAPAPARFSLPLNVGKTAPGGLEVRNLGAIPELGTIGVPGAVKTIEQAAPAGAVPGAVVPAAEPGAIGSVPGLPSETPSASPGGAPEARAPPGGRTRLDAAARASAEIISNASSLPDSEAKEKADFTLGARTDGGSVVAVEARGVQNLQPVAVFAEQKSPAVAATNARGQLLWAAGTGSVSAGLALAGVKMLGGALLGFSAPWLAAAAFPILGAAFLAATLSAGYAALGARVSAAMWKHVSKPPEGADEDAPHPVPWRERLASALTTDVATPDSQHEVLAALPARDQAVIEAHEQTHRDGHGELAAYLKQSLRHPVYVMRTIGAGAGSFISLFKRMMFGDADLAHLVRPHNKVFLGTVFLSLGDAILNPATSFLITPLLALGAASALMWTYSGIIVAMVLAYVAVELFFNIVSNTLVSRTTADFRVAYIANVLRQPIAFFARKGNSSSELANRVKLDINYLADKNAKMRTTVPHYLLYLLFGTAAGLYMNLWFGAALMVTMPIMGIVSVVIGKKISDLGSKQVDLKADLLRHVAEAFRLIPLVRASGTEDAEVDRYKGASTPILKNERSIIRRTANFTALTNLFNDLPTQLLYIVGGLLVATAYTRSLTLPMIVQLTFVAHFIQYAFQGLTGKYLALKEAEGRSAEVHKLILREPEIKDAPDAAPVAGPVGVVFDHVSFSYPTDDGKGKVKVLDDVSFEAAPGQTVAFVGPKGSGKSTMTNLVLRLEDAESGRVLVNGRDVRELDSVSLRRSMALVDQSTQLFAGTIRENIKYGSEDATDAEIERAVELAQAGFVHALPKGLDTDVKEAGSRLSGGEKQRVALARALLRRSSLLIMDEATKALDNVTEAKVLAGIDTLAHRPTRIIIAHRLSTVRRADRINVLKDGRIVESGTHDELLAKKGLYAEMWVSGGYGQNTSAAQQAGTGLAFVGLAAASAFGAKLALAGSLPLLALPAAIVGAAALLAGAAFIIAGWRVSRAMAQHLADIEARGPRGPTTRREVWTTSIASAAEDSPAFSHLSPHVQDFINRHEEAHRTKDAGEARALLAQLGGAVDLLKGEARAAREAMRAILPAMKNFIVGDKPVVDPFLKNDPETNGKYRLARVLLAVNALITVGLSFLIGHFMNLAEIAVKTKAALTWPAVAPILAAVVILTLAKPWLSRWGQLLTGDLGIAVTWKLRYFLYSKLLRRDMSFYRKEGNASSEIGSRMADDVETLAAKNVGIRLPLMQYLLTLAAAVGVMVFTSVSLSSLLLALPVLGWIGGKLAQRASQISTDYAKAKAKMVTTVQGSLERAALAKAYGEEKAEAARAGGVIQKLADMGIRMGKLTSQSWVFQSSLADLFNKYLVFIVGVALGMPIGTITMMVFLSGLVRETFSGVTEKWMAFKQAQGETQVVRAWLEQQEEAVDAPGATELTGAGPVSLRFEDVAFNYGEKDAPHVLSGLSFDIPAGQTVALVGGSGSGKSTALALAQRVLEPVGGRVTVDGRDVRSTTRKSYARAIAVVGQDAPVFNDSAEENLLYGAPADVSQEELLAAVRAAAPFLLDKEKFPDGLQTRLGEGGKKVSGGQRQCIAIARAMLRRPRLLILDEATAALDKSSELEVQAALEKLTTAHGGAGKPTILVVAHNLTTIKGADKILVLSRGRVVEEGAHRELLSRGPQGEYYKLWNAAITAPPVQEQQ